SKEKSQQFAFRVCAKRAQAHGSIRRGRLRAGKRASGKRIPGAWLQGGLRRGGDNSRSAPKNGRTRSFVCFSAGFSILLPEPRRPPGDDRSSRHNAGLARKRAALKSRLASGLLS